jgi:enhancing lycopene biosynthesis protein 2
VDKVHKLVSTPAFMYNGQFHEIQDGVGNMVRVLMDMIAATSSKQG